MNCTNCGHELKDTDRFCSRCGCLVRPEESGNPTEETKIPQNNAPSEVKTDTKTLSPVQNNVNIYENNHAPIMFDDSVGKKGNRKKIAVIAAGVVAVLILFIMVKNIIGYKIPEPDFSEAVNVRMGLLLYPEPTGWRKEVEDQYNYYYPDATSNDIFFMVFRIPFDQEVQMSEQGVRTRYYNGAKNSLAEEDALEIRSSDNVYLNGRQFFKINYTQEMNSDIYDWTTYIYANHDGYYCFGATEKNKVVDDKMLGYLNELLESIEYDECFDSHTFGQNVVVKEATCAEEGTQQTVCTVCGETINESIPKTDHVDDNNWAMVTMPTDTASGTKATHCVNCGVELQTEQVELTVGQKNAIRGANNYLKFMAFSRSGLIKQLQYEGYSTEDATFAVDNIEVDWNEQAAKKAKTYLDLMSFSKNGLIRQLQYEGFTYEQAVYGAEQNGY